MGQKQGPDIKGQIKTPHGAFFIKEQCAESNDRKHRLSSPRRPASIAPQGHIYHYPGTPCHPFASEGDDGGPEYIIKRIVIPAQAGMTIR